MAQTTGRPSVVEIGGADGAGPSHRLLLLSGLGQAGLPGLAAEVARCPYNEVRYRLIGI